MDMAFSLLRQKGVCIMNYLNDWLILAKSEQELVPTDLCSSVTLNDWGSGSILPSAPCLLASELLYWEQVSTQLRYGPGLHRNTL